MLSSIITSILDTALNAWLRLDGEALPRLKPLNQKVICIHVTGLEYTLYFFPGENGIYTMTEYDGTPDTTIRAAPTTLIKLSSSRHSAKTILESDAVIEGNIGVMENFSAVLKDVDIDWEEILSHIVGDILAYQTGEASRKTLGWMKHAHQSMTMNTTEYLQEESRILTAEAEVAYYLDQVDQLREDADRLEARIQHLQEKVDG